MGWEDWEKNWDHYGKRDSRIGGRIFSMDEKDG